MVKRTVAKWLLGIAAVVMLLPLTHAAAPEADPFTKLGVPRPEKEFKVEALTVIRELAGIDFATLEYVTWHFAEKQSDKTLQAVKKNNHSWLKLLRTSQEEKGVFGLRTTFMVQEGIPSVTHYKYIFYVVRDGHFREVTYEPEQPLSFRGVSSSSTPRLHVTDWDTFSVYKTPLPGQEWDRQAVNIDYAGDQALQGFGSGDTTIRLFY